MLGAELAEFGEGGGGLAGVDSLCPHGYALFEVEGETGGIESGRGVEKDNVAASAWDAGKDVVEVGGVGLGVSAGELI